jgi:dUTP pyrophosphatase
MYAKGKVRLLEDKSLKELSVSIEELSPGSHTKVYVECTRCGEIFKREFRNLYQLHCCPTHKTIDNIRYKWCNKCQKWKEIGHFSPNNTRHDKLAPQCNPCRQDKGATPERIKRLRLKRSTFNGWLNRLYIQKRSNCKKNGTTFAINERDLHELWAEQDGRCYYSKVPLQWNSKSLYGAQLDRLIPNAGYIPGNIVWASKALNNCKNDAPLDNFREFLSKAILDVPVRCEFQKIHQNAKLPTRKRATDAGLDIYAVEDIEIPSHTSAKIGTGLRLVVPPGYYYTIEGRSGYWKHNLMPFRGIIDATYSGELMITMMNLAEKHQVIHTGDRFAQIVMHQFVHVDIAEVEAISPEYEGRGEAGHGDSGGINTNQTKLNEDEQTRKLTVSG